MRRIALLALLPLAGCSAPQNYMFTGGRAARELAEIGWPVLVGLSLVTVVTWAIIWWVAYRRPGSFDWHAPPDAGGGQNWILIGGVAVPVAVLATMFIATLGTLSNFPMAHAATAEPDIRVIGKLWWFDAQYLPGGSICGEDVASLGRHPASGGQGQSANLIVHSPSEIHIPVGVPVEIELETRDVIHSFWVPKLHGKVDLVPGLKNRIRIQADEPGQYEGECGEYCGVQHAHMRLVVVAESPGDYLQWLQRMRQPAAPVSDPQLVLGREVFERSACAMCHVIRGTAAHGEIGPELTHVGSRLRIAGATLPNNTANMEAWVTDAQSLKPGVVMPSLRAYSGPELRALVAYLESLK